MMTEESKLIESQFSVDSHRSLTGTSSEFGLCLILCADCV